MTTHNVVRHLQLGQCPGIPRACEPVDGVWLVQDAWEGGRRYFQPRSHTDGYSDEEHCHLSGVWRLLRRGNKKMADLRTVRRGDCTRVRDVAPAVAADCKLPSLGKGVLSARGRRRTAGGKGAQSREPSTSHVGSHD